MHWISEISLLDVLAIAALGIAIAFLFFRESYQYRRLLDRESHIHDCKKSLRLLREAAIAKGYDIEEVPPRVVPAHVRLKAR